MAYSLDQSLGFITGRLANRLTSELEQNFIRHGINATSEQWKILVRICEEEGLPQNEIANRTGKDKTNVARILALMERHGLIERRVSSRDSRVMEIYPTDAGQSTYEAMVVAAKEVLDRAQHGLSSAEIQNLIDMLHKVYDNLS